MADALPDSVRFVKNGEHGKWWKAAKERNQIHAGFADVPVDLLRAADMVRIEPIIRARYGSKPGARQDFNALRTLLDQPSQHIWVTFEDGCMWWCTVKDGVETNPDGETDKRGHFWLNCAMPWSNQSVDHVRYLATSELPGNVAMVAGFRGTLCRPKAWSVILRIIRNEEDADVKALTPARRRYEDATAKLIERLQPKDFEVLVDLILARSGWTRIAKLGGTTEGIDIEVENASLDERAFVQVKSSADQAVLNDYVERFNERKDRYQRMIFAVHSPKQPLSKPCDRRVQVWTGTKIADLAVKSGLSDWVAKRF